MKKLTTALLLLLLFLSFYVQKGLKAQTLEAQFSFGIHLPEAFLEDAEQLKQSSTIINPKYRFAQAGIGFRIKYFRGFGLRLEGNFRGYETEITAIGNGIFDVGTIYHNKFCVAILPEYRTNHMSGFFISAGPTAFFEIGKNALVKTYMNLRSSEQEPMRGWQVSAGVRPQLRNRIGLLLEARHGRTYFQTEDPKFIKISYKIFNFLAGITFDLAK